jgi:hypothetical protein
VDLVGHLYHQPRGDGRFPDFFCCRTSKATIYALAVIAGVCSLAQVGVAIFSLVVLSGASYCYPLEMIFWTNSDDYFDGTDCNEAAWASVAFVGAAFWAASAICMFTFASSGQHARWERKHIKKPGIEVDSNPATLELVGATLEAKVGPPSEVEEGGDRRRSHDRDGCYCYSSYSIL